MHPAGGSSEVSALREGGGRIDLAPQTSRSSSRAPTSLGWGLVRRGFSGTKELVDRRTPAAAAAPWTVSIAAQSMPHGAQLEPQATTLVGGGVSRAQAHGLCDREGRRRHRLRRPDPRQRRPPDRRSGSTSRRRDCSSTRTGSFAGRASTTATPPGSRRASPRIAIPKRGLAPGVPTRLGGPEQVFRFTLRRPVANFGIAIVHLARGVRVSPRLVAGTTRTALVGYTGLPATLNPYQGLSRAEPVVGAVLPDPGTTSSSSTRRRHAKPGAFTFRFWVNDTSPPSIRRLARKDVIGRPHSLRRRRLGLRRRPARSFHARIGARIVRVRYANGVLFLRTSGLRPGKRTVTVRASDYQETKNMEDVGPVLPNTRVLHTTVTFRR